jgi:hypothetical protein
MKITYTGDELDAKIRGFLHKKQAQYSDLQLPAGKLYRRVVEHDNDFWNVMNNSDKEERHIRMNPWSSRTV